MVILYNPSSSELTFENRFACLFFFVWYVAHKRHVISKNKFSQSALLFFCIIHLVAGRLLRIFCTLVCRRLMSRTSWREILKSQLPTAFTIGNDYRAVFWEFPICLAPGESPPQQTEPFTFSKDSSILHLYSKSRSERTFENCTAKQSPSNSQKNALSIVFWVFIYVAVCCSVLQCVAVCCSVLHCVAVQCVAVCCSVLQCVAVKFSKECSIYCFLVFYMANLHAACYSVLQRVAVCCSVLQCVAVCCSVLQCAAVCCSVCSIHFFWFFIWQIFYTANLVASRLATFM